MPGGIKITAGAIVENTHLTAAIDILGTAHDDMTNTDIPIKISLPSKTQRNVVQSFNMDSFTSATSPAVPYHMAQDETVENGQKLVVEFVGVVQGKEVFAGSIVKHNGNDWVSVAKIVFV
jgi:hypothetical protein